jgi:hypothetical protein
MAQEQTNIDREQRVKNKFENIEQAGVQSQPHRDSPQLLANNRGR